MCGACHAKRDRRFPSRLDLGGKCWDCHNQCENPSLGGLESPGKTFSLVVAAGKGLAPADLPAFDIPAREGLAKAGFSERKVNAPVDVELMVVVSAVEMREPRFLPRGYRVIRAVGRFKLAVTGDTMHTHERVFYSRPEYGKTAEEARALALEDLWAVMAPSVIEIVTLH